MLREEIDIEFQHTKHRKTFKNEKLEWYIVSYDESQMTSINTDSDLETEIELYLDYSDDDDGEKQLLELRVIFEANAHKPSPPMVVPANNRTDKFDISETGANSNTNNPEIPQPNPIFHSIANANTSAFDNQELPEEKQKITSNEKTADIVAKTQSDQIQHIFIEEPDAVNSVPSSSKVCVVMVGTTGVGKSSLVKIFSSQSVIVSSATSSTTKGCKLFHATPYDFLDTQGADDSDAKDVDEKILKQILQKLYFENISAVKLVWMLAGDMTKEKGEYHKQAQFIKSIQGTGNKIDNNSDSYSVWSSCLIIKKNGDFLPNKALAGPIAAAQNAGSTIDYNQNGSLFLLGYTCLDWIKIKDHSALRYLFQYCTDEQKRNAELFKGGFLTTEQIKSEVLKRLQNLKTMHIAFKHQKCEKCGVVGDERFIYEKCHVQKELYHSKKLEFFHLQGTEFYHFAGLVNYHPENHENYHWGQLSAYHQQDLELIHTSQETEFYHNLQLERYHSQNQQEIQGSRYHPAKTVFVECTACKKDVTGNHFLHSKKFVDSQMKKSYLSGAVRKYENFASYLFVCNFSDRNVYFKCNLCHKPTETTTGCLTHDKSYQWACCNLSTVDPGCKKRYRCCEREEKSEGCTQRYVCCKNPHLSVGCHEQYRCCSKVRNSTGCKRKYECCNGIRNSTGCRTRYKCCGKNTTEKGCEEQYSCCEGNLNSAGCEERYLCCFEGKESKGCATRYSCCNVLYSVKNGNDDASIDGCEYRCSRCKIEWGIPPGCTFPEKDSGMVF